VNDVTWGAKYENILQPTCTLYAFPFIEIRHSKQQSIPTLQVYIHLWIQMTRNIIRIACDLVQSKIRLFSIPFLIVCQEGNTAFAVLIRYPRSEATHISLWIYHSTWLFKQFKRNLFVTGCRDIRTFFRPRQVSVQYSFFFGIIFA
jgi:hypothetical protein